MAGTQSSGGGEVWGGVLTESGCELQEGRGCQGKAVAAVAACMAAAAAAAAEAVAGCQAVAGGMNRWR
jgi:hypothetical protein